MILKFILNFVKMRVYLFIYFYFRFASMSIIACRWFFFFFVFLIFPPLFFFFLLLLRRFNGCRLFNLFNFYFFCLKIALIFVGLPESRSSLSKFSDEPFFFDSTIVHFVFILEREFLSESYKEFYVGSADRRRPRLPRRNNAEKKGSFKIARKRNCAII